MLKKHLLLVFACLFVAGLQAQTTGSGNDKAKPQNQKKYLQYDINHNPYNYDNRKGVDMLMQPRVSLPADTPVPAYQSSGSKGKRQSAFLNKEAYYPAKPRNQWEIGINVGSSMVSGDVTPVMNPLKNWGAGLYVRKALGYTASLRLRYLYGVSTGQDWKPKANGFGDKGYNGFNTGAPDYVANPSLGIMDGIFFRNFRNYHHELALEGVITLGNMKFHRERSRFNSYLSFGIGALAYKTMLDIGDNTNNNSEYDYEPMFERYYADKPSETSNANFYRDRRKDVLDLLKDMQDGEYESMADASFTQNSIFKNHTLQPTVNFGFALGYHVTKWLTLNLETRVTWAGDDLLDGQRFLDDLPIKGGYQGSLTPSNDNLVYTGLDVNFHIFKKATEPLWWLNPMDYVYKRIGDMDPEAFMKDYMNDDDSDGVVNKFDLEPLTPKGFPANLHGIALDSDNDGCRDGEDPERFSSPELPIVNCKNVFPKCCDSVNNAGPGPVGHGTDCSKISLPDLVFAVDKYGIKPESYAVLHLIAEKMQLCPDFNIVLTSYADYNTNLKYNEQLSWNRQNQVVQYMVEKYGISRDRFSIIYKADKKATEGNDMNQRRIQFRFANDGDPMKPNPPAPHPGLKAGSEY